MEGDKQQEKRKQVEKERGEIDFTGIEEKLSGNLEERESRGWGYRKKPQQFTLKEAHLNEGKKNIHAR